MKFVGRAKEIEILERNYNSPESKLVVIYGRRRVGKSTLVHKFGEKKNDFYSFEAAEKLDGQEQISHFINQLNEKTRDPFLSQIGFSDWAFVFKYLTEKIIVRQSKKKLILFFDEIQWMGSGKEKLISIIKFYWDNHWKDKNVMLVLCGSVASYMVKKVLRSKALYGRVSEEILLKGLNPPESYKMFSKKKSEEEILKYLMVFGAIPKYLEEIDQSQSFNHNINRLCFSKNGLMINEPERIFYAQFREVRTYQQIVHLLSSGLFSMQEISEKLKIASGGGLKMYLDNLEHAEIIRHVIPFDKNHRTKLKKYTIADEFLTFYFKYMEPNLAEIRESNSGKLFEAISQNSFQTWLGFAFERFCLKNGWHIANLMGFGDEVLRVAPYYGKGDNSFQIDLLFKRADKVITVCEIKHHSSKISTKIIPEVERKCALFDIPKGYSIETALISLYGPDKPLKESRFFDHSVTLKDILN
jgi:uncharacterized protein